MPEDPMSAFSTTADEATLHQRTERSTYDVELVDPFLDWRLDTEKGSREEDAEEEEVCAET